MRYLSIIIFVLIAAFSSSPQFLEAQNYPQNYFRKPLDIKLVLSGTFAELRSGHFHSGIDIKTQGHTGLRVYAAADGYVSRIKISPFGYGKAVYIKHPNGYTSVYAHLSKLMPKLDSVVKAYQYSKESFAVDFYPKAGQIKVKKSEVIAKSGNSGGSGGPHLHFEIRDKAQRPINPLLFGIDIADNIKPKVYALRIYQNNNQLYNTMYNEVKLNRSGIINLKDTFETAEEFYIGVQSDDQLNDAVNRNGIFILKMTLDSNPIFQFKANKIDFSQKRFINAFLDYGCYYEKKKRFQQSKLWDGNRLMNLETYGAKGIFKISDNKVHWVVVNIMDFKGNKSSIRFHVKQNASMRNMDIQTNTSWKEFKTYENDIAKVIIPAKTFYGDIFFEMNSSRNTYTPYSDLVSIGDPHIPLHQYIGIQIKANQNLSKKLYSKAALASLSKRNHIIYEGGAYANGVVSGKSRSFGSYFIVVDTIAPKIKAENIYNGKNISSLSKISVKVSDDLSGIQSYKAWVNGKWVLGDYDAKKNRITYKIDEHFPKGSFYFKIEIVDQKNNTARALFKLKR